MLFRIDGPYSPSPSSKKQLIAFPLAYACSIAAGGAAALAKLSEVLFIETLRRYIALLPSEQRGWLAGVRDPALALLHRRPAHPWTIAALAGEVGISRSVLAECFQRYISETPMAYLTRWRLQLGAQMLNLRVTAWRRLPVKSAMNRSRPLTAPSNASSAFPRLDSVVNRKPHAREPSATPDKRLLSRKLYLNSSGLLPPS